MRPDQRLFYAGRPSAAAPAGGYLSRHNQRQKAVVEQAFGKYK
jgi:2-oxoglutarate dehydrogenase E1 component